MTTDFVVFISHQTLLTALYILFPILGSALLVGVLVGLFQAVTSIQEITLTFIPKIAVVGMVILLLIPWMLDIVLRYALLVFDHIAQLGL
ncbi:MAG: flagellar type III secretion system protein FliQ [Candidatus Marinimicrobia bacterium]|nr:flagellar type III secretion system protein FliQ [Candidatus Neomarinimicrobiota bacterium]